MNKDESIKINLLEKFKIADFLMRFRDDIISNVEQGRFLSVRDYVDTFEIEVLEEYRQENRKLKNKTTEEIIKEITKEITKAVSSYREYEKIPLIIKIDGEEIYSNKEDK